MRKALGPIGLLISIAFVIACTPGQPARDHTEPLRCQGPDSPAPDSADMTPWQPAMSVVGDIGGGSLEPIAEATVSSCPAGMVLVEGQFCPEVEQPCRKWLEDPVKFPFARCAEFAPSQCKSSERVTMRFCIDKYEAADSDGLPAGNVSWTEASARCQKEGKRLCREQEWLFACEGEEMMPYPYGLVRDSSACNFERKDGLVTNKGDLADHRQSVQSNPGCLSPFGVQNMVGNIDEWVVLERPHYSARNGGRKMLSGLKGGWWGPLRNRCRPTTVDHDELFHELQTGYRCCADTSGQKL